MSYQYFDAQGNNYVRPWNNDFTDAERQELGIGEYRDPATYEMPTAEQEQHNSWPGSAEEILQRMQDAERVKQSGERFPFEVSPSNEPTGWDRYPTGGIDPLGDRSERIEVIPYSEEETNARKWGLLNSLVDVIKAGGSKLGDFLYGDTDFGYMEGTQEQRRNAADEARRREFAEKVIRERDQSREWRERDIMDKDSAFGVDMWGNKY